MKTCFLKYLKDNLMSWAVLVKAENKVVRKRIEEMAEVICENGDAASPAKRESIEVHLSSFIELIQDDGRDEFKKSKNRILETVDINTNTRAAGPSS